MKKKEEEKKTSQAKIKGVKIINIRKIKKPDKGCSCKLTYPNLNMC